MLPTPLLLLLLLLAPLTTPAPASVHDISFDEFLGYVERSKLPTTTTSVPMINQRELASWGIQLEAPVMDSWSCDQKIFFVTLSACGGTCRKNGQFAISEEDCTMDALADKVIMELCCPEMLAKLKDEFKTTTEQGQTKEEAEQSIIEMIRHWFD